MFDNEALAAFIGKAVREAVREEMARLPPPGPEFLTIAEAAALVSVSPSTIGEWFRAKRLVRYGKGRAVRVKRAELLSLMESERVQPDGLSRDEIKALAARIAKRGSH